MNILSFNDYIFYNKRILDNEIIKCFNKESDTTIKQIIDQDIRAMIDLMNKRVYWCNVSVYVNGSQQDLRVARYNGWYYHNGLRCDESNGFFELRLNRNIGCKDVEKIFSGLRNDYIINGEQTLDNVSVYTDKIVFNPGEYCPEQILKVIKVYKHELECVDIITGELIKINETMFNIKDYDMLKRNHYTIKARIYNSNLTILNKVYYQIITKN
jgi:hypothetical protein